LVRIGWKRPIVLRLLEVRKHSPEFRAKFPEAEAETIE